MNYKNKESTNNIWSKESFKMCGLGEKNKALAHIKHCKRCIQWSWQRIVRGYADCDKWNMYGYLQILIPDMLQDLRYNRSGSPSYLGENYISKEGLLMNDTCHEEWDRVLDKMIFLWRESNEATCTQKNPYKQEYDKAFAEYTYEFGFFGKLLQSEEEIEENKKYGGGGTIHLMDELPKYKDISKKYHEAEEELEKYRIKSKNEAFDLLQEHFFSLWD